MFAVDGFAVKLKPPRSVLSIGICHYMYIWNLKLREIKTTAKGPLEENREI